ncbi:MAG: SUMF1/EgtB/PvdO family nonheme iron enzyme, partial [Myxococcota bacterium]
DPASCNTEDADGNKRTPGPTGAFAQCRSGYGPSDMSGNVAEWVAGADGRSILKGGSADKPAHAVRCAAKVIADPGKASDTIGYRCCTDAD